MYNIYVRNIWTHETRPAGTAPDVYCADRRSMAINTRLREMGDVEHYSYFEPAGGWGRLVDAAQKGVMQ